MTQPERIERYLAARSTAGEAAVTGYDEIGGGYSRLMAEFTVTTADGERHLVWRGDPPPEQQIVETDRAREFALLSSLPEAAGAPRAHHFDADGSELGAVSLILDYVEGDQLLTVLKASPESEWPRLVDAVAKLAAGIHATGLADVPDVLERPAGWDAHIDICVEAWRALEREQVEPAPLLRYVATWLDRNRPPEVPLTLVHGDLQSPNVILDDGRARAIDWEFARIGDPREDLGYFAAMAALTPPDPVAGDLTELCRAYREHSGLSEAEVNPATVAYFSILPFGPMVRQFTGQVAELVAGNNRSLKTANLAMVVTAMLQGWVGLTHMLDAATHAQEEAPR